ncbi:MAG: acetyl-CoA C-acyltransferase [Saprospiraceae bacterium]|nr:acetyl-CoA C-acyltransferase [Saprospiraceae bacterium]MCB9328490.1 acetyl-CoA C-acyltransferase [Lewinellaceae bacterium]
MNKVFIVSAVRTPMGSFGGKLKDFSATQLGSIAIKGALEAAKVDVKAVDEVYFGNVIQANLGQAPAKQAALGAGIGNNVPCTTINKVCSSGMKSVMIAAQGIMTGQGDIMVAGGMESMSNIPYYLPNMRWGAKYGDVNAIDGLQKDGLTDAYNHKAMGVSADATAAKFSISREDQDAFAIQSYKRAATATESGFFKEEIVPVSIPQRKGDPILMTEDEEYKNVFFDKIPALRPAFNKEGTVTAANASTINDGASALVLASEKAVNELGLKPIAEILAFADAAQEPDWFTTAPTLAVPKALKMAGLDKNDVDFYEVNEAFAVVTMAFNKTLDISEDKVNINGGAVALGHPLGASGARIITTLAHTLNQKNGEIGCATLCNGGGGASAIIIKKV